MAPVALSATAAVAIAVAVGFRHLSRASREARDRAFAAEQAVAALSRSQAQAQQELDFLSRFVREFPHLTRDLHATPSQRDICRLVLKVVMRTLQPARAVVLRRHVRQPEGGPAQTRFLAVAASPEGFVRPGAEVGVPGTVLELALAGQTVVSRRDQGPTGAAAPAGIDYDLVAPLVFGEETLGLVALGGPARSSDDAKAALRLIAQVGAQALHSAAAYQQVQTAANLDGLTGVLNKRHLTRLLGELLVECGRRQGCLSVFLFDVDNFKHYNDVNGHLEGDQLLRELAGLVRDNVRQEDVFGRFGGEEFLVVLPGTPLEAGLAVAEKLRGLVAAHPFAFGERQPLGRVSISGGVAEFPNDALDSLHLVKAADAALYAAKHSGRNRVLPAERRDLSGPPETDDPALA